MSWWKDFFGQADNKADTAPVPQFQPGEHKIGLNVRAKNGTKFIVRVVVSKWDHTGFGSGPYGWVFQNAWEWTTDAESLDTTKAEALEYAQQYIDNTKRNDRKVIHIKE